VATPCFLHSGAPVGVCGTGTMVRLPWSNIVEIWRLNHGLFTMVEPSYDCRFYRCFYNGKKMKVISPKNYGSTMVRPFWDIESII